MTTARDAAEQIIGWLNGGAPQGWDAEFVRTGTLNEDEYAEIAVTTPDGTPVFVTVNVSPS